MKREQLKRSYQRCFDEGFALVDISPTPGAVKGSGRIVRKLAEG